MSNRKEIKAGKHERIRKLLNNIRATQPEPMVRDFFDSSLGEPANISHSNSSCTAYTLQLCCEDDSHLQV